MTLEPHPKGEKATVSEEAVNDRAVMRKVEGGEKAEAARCKAKYRRHSAVLEDRLSPQECSSSRQ